jgi:hypothetical protein
LEVFGVFVEAGSSRREELAGGFAQAVLQVGASSPDVFGDGGVELVA